VGENLPENKKIFSPHLLIYKIKIKQFGRICQEKMPDVASVCHKHTDFA